MKTLYKTWIIFTIVISYSYNVNAQLPTCGSNVPFFQVDLSGDPDGTWESPSHSRLGNCCGTTSPDRCTSFEIILDTGAAMINFEIASGAIPTGSMYYQIDCGPQVPVGQPICISGVGPHNLTFCKPGNNPNTYRVTSIPKPIYPEDDSTRIGCILPVEILGLENITINSVYPGSVGDYNSYLSCTDCGNPDFEPGLASPSYIDYEICGTPTASACGYVYSCDTVRLYAFQPLNSSVSPNPAEFCSGGGGVVLTASSTGGDANYLFEWFNSSSSSVGTGSTYNATTEENFTVEISDGLNSPTCPSRYITVPVTIGQPPSVNAGTDQTVCANDPRTYLNASVADADGGVWTGGNGSFEPNDSTLFASYLPTQSEIASGSVTLTLTSYGAGGGCSNDFDQITISFSDTVDISFTTPTLNCYDSEGVLTANVSSGTTPYTFLWSAGETTASILAGQGTYWVDVTDAIGCSHSESVTLSAPSEMNLTMSSTDVTTDGGSDGTASVSVSGGTPPYSYSWNTGGTASTETGLSYGIATVTVTDANGCTKEGSVVVNEPQCLAFSVSASSTNVSCFNGSDGTVSASATGGTSPYTYSWDTSPVSSGTTVTNLPAGTYTITANDAGTCVDLATVVITEPTELINTMSHTDVDVIGDNTGTATANPSGGTPAYSYLWSPGGETTQSIINLFAGTYYVDITDANSCSLSDSVIINEPPCNNFEVGLNVNNVSCNNGTDGSASVVIAHGTPPYTINWSDGQTGYQATNLAAGSYTVTVTDSTNCTTFQNFTVIEPTQLNVGLTPTNISCNGANDGTIDLSATGGTYPYTYQWEKGGGAYANSEDLVNLRPGTYSVIVADQNGCMDSASVGITQPAQLIATSIKENTLCNGDSNGSIDASVSGGTMPYVYSWEGPSGYTASSEDISGLGAGLYNVSVVDANGCTLLEPHSVYIDQPDTVIIHNIVADCPTPGSSTTTVTVDSVTGGTEDLYDISFDNGTTFNGLGNYSTSLAIGSTYQVVARDSNSCLTNSPYSLTVDPAVTISDVSFNPCIPVGATDIPVTVTATGGDAGPYEVSTDNGVTFNPAGTYTLNLAVGNSYTIVVRDTKGCLSLAYSISIPNELTASAIILNEVSCLGESDGSIDLTVNGGATPYSYSWTGPSGFTATTEDITGLIEGTYDVTVTDDSSCTATASVNLTTTVDNTAPTISCPSDITENNDAGLCEAVINYATPVGIDNCPLGVTTVMTTGLASGSAFPVGTTLVTYEVTDSAGNSASCNFNVTVNDNENPTISCPADVTVSNDVGTCEAASVTLGTPTSGDNCGVATVTNDAPATFPVGTTTVTWTVTDIHGNTETCTQDVTVNDSENPTITCPADVTVNNDAGACSSSTVSLGTPTTSDNCGVATVTNDAPSTFPVGTTTVTWTVTDIHGNSISCTQDVTVDDTENPTITCPTDVTVSNDPGNCSTDGTNVSLGNPTTGDNCGVATVTNDAPATFPVGTTTVIWTVTDIHGNTATCTQDVIVNDNENPTITCPADVTVSNDVGTCEAASVTLGTPTTGDNCGVATVTNDAPAIFPVGTTTVTWTVTDIHGNTETCTQDVTVNDSENPTITCPADVTVNNDAGICSSSTVSLGTPTTSDNCGVATVTNDAPATFPVGTTAVTWTVTDIHGNTVTCTQYVTVNDTESPTITCPTDVTVSNDPGNCSTDGTNVSLGNPTTGDNCGVATVTNDAPATFPVGTTTVTWTVTDIHGNTATCTQDVTVNDNEDPVFVSCPTDQNEYVDNNCEHSIIDYTLIATYSDNCGATIVQDPVAGTVMSTGDTTITLTITDDAGNTNTCIFTLTVSDTISPTFINCPVDIIVSNDAGNCSALVNWTVPSYNDNCGAILNSNYNSGDAFDVGTTTVTYIATDDAGNTDTCSFDVTVEDNENPVVAFCPADTSSCFPVVSFDPVLATDNCGIDTVIQISGLVSGSTFPIGTTTQEFEITDIHGNTTICSFDVTINSLPTSTGVVTDVTCFGVNDGGIDLTVNDGTSPYTFNWSNGETTEDISNVGPGTYDVTVIDANSCTYDTSFVVLEADSLYAEFNSKDVSCYDSLDGAIEIFTFGGTSPYSYNWSNNDTTATIDSLAAGNYDLTITDDNGCTHQLSVTINQPDSLYLTSVVTDATCLSADGSIEIDVNGGVGGYTYLWSDTSTMQDLNNVVSGNYSVVVSDTNGCSISYTDSIGSVNPLTASVFVKDVLCYGGRSGGIELQVNNATSPVSYAWDTGDTTSSVSGLYAGNYEVTVTDSNQCELILSYTIEEPDSMYAEIYSPENEAGFNVTSYNGNDGSIDLSVFGGSPPYNYVWSNGATDEDLYDLTSGYYSVVVSDSNGCVVQVTDSLTQPYELELPTGFSPNEDGYNDSFVIKGIEGFPNNELLIYNRWGNLVYSTEGYKNEWVGQNNSGKTLPDGTYFVILKVDELDEPLSGYVDMRRSRDGK